MRYFFDTEFIERPCTIDLISIGVVAEDGRHFYAESTETNWSAASPWVIENVRPHLTFAWPEQRRFIDETAEELLLAAPRAEIASQLRRWIGDDKPEFWGYYADYDWVVFCWLFGTMMDLPAGWPMYCRDVKQWADTLGNPRLPEQSTTEHHAMADALWTREAWEFLGGLGEGA